MKRYKVMISYKHKRIIKLHHWIFENITEHEYTTQVMNAKRSGNSVLQSFNYEHVLFLVFWWFQRNQHEIWLFIYMQSLAMFSFSISTIWSIIVLQKYFLRIINLTFSCHYLQIWLNDKFSGLPYWYWIILFTDQLPW